MKTTQFLNALVVIGLSGVVYPHSPGAVRHGGVWLLSRELAILRIRAVRKALQLLSVIVVSEPYASDHSVRAYVGIYEAEGGILIVYRLFHRFDIIGVDIARTAAVGDIFGGVVYILGAYDPAAVFAGFYKLSVSLLRSFAEQKHVEDYKSRIVAQGIYYVGVNVSLPLRRIAESGERLSRIVDAYYFYAFVYTSRILIHKVAGAVVYIAEDIAVRRRERQSRAQQSFYCREQSLFIHRRCPFRRTFLRASLL